MKRLLTTFLALALSSLVAQTPQKPGTQPSIIDQAKIEAERKKKAESQRKSLEATQQLLKERLHKETTLYPEEGSEYTHPGVVVLQNGEWQGTDNIFNISNHIAVGVEFVVPDEGSFPVKSEAIRSRVKGILQSAGITPQAEVVGDKPPLPLLNIVLIAQPINKGFAVYCAGNLIEEVDPKRIRITNGAYQAITWDRQHIVVTPTEETNFHINKCVDDIAFTFVKLYRYYRDVKPQRSEY